MGIGPADVIAYLIALADHPDGVAHRDWLFHAVRLIQRREIMDGVTK